MNDRPLPVQSRRQRLNAKLADYGLERGLGLAVNLPVHVYLQIASACNLDCYMCSEHNRPEDQNRGRSLVSLAPELFRSLEREVFPDSTHLHLGVGGEATLSGHFSDYVECAGRAGQVIHLTTNGTRLHLDDNAEVIARHVSFVQLSIDAATAETYERIRIGARWERLLQNIELLNERRAAHSDRRLHLTLCFVLMRSNVHELPAFVELAHTVGADAVYAQHVIPVTEESRQEPLSLEPELYNRFRAEASERARELDLALEIPSSYAIEAPITVPAELPSVIDEQAPGSAAPPAPVDRSIPCSLPSRAVYVLYDGRVFPCCHPFAHCKMLVGNLGESSFSAIWNGRHYRNLRAGIKTGQVPQVCRNCSLAHDPPPAHEDPDELAASLELADFYADQDLAPVVAEERGALPTEWLAATGWQEFFSSLSEHADTLEDERPGMYEHIATLEREQVQLRKHASELERQLLESEERRRYSGLHPRRLSRWFKRLLNRE